MTKNHNQEVFLQYKRRKLLLKAHLVGMSWFTNHVSVKLSEN